MTNCEKLICTLKIISDEIRKLIFYNVSRELFKGWIDSGKNLCNFECTWFLKKLYKYKFL